MIETLDLAMEFAPATAGDIAVINLESARQQSWSRFWQAPERPGIAEYIVEQEQLTAQFLGDLSAFDRLDSLVNQLARVDAHSPRTALIQAQVASASHRFAEARGHLAQADVPNAPSEAIDRLLLSIDQACGVDLGRVLETRRRMVAKTGRLEDLVPLGALFADLRDFDEAERIYCRALREYQDVSPFGLAWVCFQLGMLWGELVSEPQSSRAAQWYRKAIEYMPRYVKARVHLAEIYSRCDQTGDAEDLLKATAVSSDDPEVTWRLADVMYAKDAFTDADMLLNKARSGFEVLLAKHLLAFADHGAEFYSGSGNDARRAFELASLNFANRPTLRAFEQAYATAVGAGETRAASDILTAAEGRWGATTAFALSPLAARRTESVTSLEQSHEYLP